MENLQEWFRMAVLLETGLTVDQLFEKHNKKIRYTINRTKGLEAQKSMLLQRNQLWDKLFKMPVENPKRRKLINKYWYLSYKIYHLNKQQTR